MLEARAIWFLSKCEEDRDTQEPKRTGWLSEGYHVEEEIREEDVTEENENTGE